MKKSVFALLSIFISTSLFAQNKSLELIQYEAIYGPLPVEKKEQKPKGKYDHLNPDLKQRYEEIDRQNAELLSKDPNSYRANPQTLGIIANPQSGSLSSPRVSRQTGRVVSVDNVPMYSSSFMATNQRKISELVTSWSGKEGQYFLWSYSKDYDIFNAAQFNSKTHLNEAVSLDDALQKVFTYIGLLEINNPTHLPPKICYNGTTNTVVDGNVECD